MSYWAFPLWFCCVGGFKIVKGHQCIHFCIQNLYFWTLLEYSQSNFAESNKGQLANTQSYSLYTVFLLKSTYLFNNSNSKDALPVKGQMWIKCFCILFHILSFKKNNNEVFMKKWMGRSFIGLGHIIPFAVIPV